MKTRIVATAVLVSLASSPYIQAVQADLEPMAPVRCEGKERIVVNNRLIEGAEDAILATEACQVEIIASTVVGGRYGVHVTGAAVVHVRDSVVEGRRSAIFAENRATVHYSGSRTRGGLSKMHRARLIDEGGNEVDGVGSATASDDWRQLGSDLYDAADTLRLLDELGAETSDGETELALAGDVLFAFDSSEVRSEAVARLRMVAHVVRELATAEVQVVGHTDSVGGVDYNLTLSQRRAMAVMTWLAENEGIPLGRMRGSGVGAAEPIAYNAMPDGTDNPAGRAKNRRVEIRFSSGSI